MKVLVACERSGKVREAFRAKGHEAYSADILPVETPSPYHIQGDVLDILEEGWDMMIAFPPCTYLANSGARWLYNVDKTFNEQRFKLMEEGAEFFNALLNAPIPRIAIENPIQHRYARKLIRKYDQIIQPYQFGHGETKATALWLKGLQKLVPTNIVEGREHRIYNLGISSNRSYLRSITYTGIAEAMAEQWSMIRIESLYRWM